MVSESKIHANRQNALKSTGPLSPEGKATVSQNALKHGLLSQGLLLKDEKRNELESFQDRFYNDLLPVGALETILVEKLIQVAWRLRRVTKVEGEFFDAKADFFSRNSGLAQAFSSYNKLQTLCRYETNLEKSFYKALHELQRLQGIRLGHPVTAPISIEVNVEDPSIGFVS